MTPPAAATTVANRGATSILVKPRRWRGPVPVAALATLAFLLTTGLRLLNFGRSADVFGDEVNYRDLGVSVASGGFPRFNGFLFFLHPPGYFYLEAGWQRIFGYRPDLVSGIYEMRELNAVLAGGTAALLIVLVARIRSRPAAVVAALLFALDAYCLRVNGRVLLETATMFWVIAGYAVLVPLIGRSRPTHRRARVVLVGLFFGLAILTKDESILVTVLPLLVLLTRNWRPPRRLLLAMSGIAVAPYCVYVLVIAGNDHFDTFLNEKLRGVRRMLGLLQETGFNAPKAPSLLSRITDQLSSFGASYALLALGVVAVVVLWRRGDAPQRLLALCHTTAFLFLGYALVLGTLEEQELYLLLVPTLASVPVAASLLAGRGTRRRRLCLRAVFTAFLAAWLGFSGMAYHASRTQADDGYAQLRVYLAAHVPPESVITTPGGPTNIILEDRYRIGAWLLPGDRYRAGVRYAVVAWSLVDQGYASWTPEQASALTHQGTLLFSHTGRSFGRLALYRLPLPPAPPAPPPPRPSHAH